MPDSKKVVTAYLDAINGKPKTEDILEQYVSDPSLKEHIQFFETAFPQYELISDDIITEGNKVVVRATMRGKHLGEIMGIAATGKEVATSLMLIYEIENGKIANHWMVADQFALMQQLGVIK